MFDNVQAAARISVVWDDERRVIPPPCARYQQVRNFRRRPPIRLDPGRPFRRAYAEFRLSPNAAFFRDIFKLIWAYRRFSLAIVLVTIVQEVAALWPVTLLGQFVDRLGTESLGNVVWLLLGSSLLAPGFARANIILRHKMFYTTDFEKQVELILAEADRGDCIDAEDASAAHTSILNATSGITNAVYHILGSFVPVITKIVVVAGKLLGYSQSLGLIYLASLLLPAALTLLFNNKLRLLQNTQYSVISRATGAGVKTISDRANAPVRERFLRIMSERRDVYIALVTRSQIFIYIREAVLVGSQFLVVFVALGMRQQLGLTPGDFTKMIGYTAQVAAAFITTATVYDAIVSYSRAYAVFAKRGQS